MSELNEKVKSELNKLRPALQADGGDVKFVSVSDEGVVKVKLTGACAGCPMSQMTLKSYIQQQLTKKISEVKKVVGA